MTKTELCLVYITAADDKEAAAIAGVLLKDKLIACANIVNDARSLCVWEGKPQDGKESLLIAKTKRSLMQRVIARVTELHSYDCPCVVALPIIEANPAYAEWVTNQCL